MQRVPTLIPSFINGKINPAQHNSLASYGTLPVISALLLEKFACLPINP